MIRKEKFEQLESAFDLWTWEVKHQNLRTYTDINRYSEGFIAELLTLLKGEEYKDLNEIYPDFPGVDLGCENSNTAYQVSSTVNTAKIIKTYNAVYSNNIGDDRIIDVYPNIRFLEIAQPKKEHDFSDDKLNDIAQLSGGQFQLNHIVDVNDLIKEIESLFYKAPDKFDEILELVLRNIGNCGKKVTDKKVVTDILSYLNRPAFTVPFERECSIEEYLNALLETSSLISTGKKSELSNETKCCINDVQDRKLAERIALLRDGVNTLRKLSLQMTDQGLITQADLFTDEVEIDNTYTHCGELLNDLRAVLLAYAEKLAKDYNVNYQIYVQYPIRKGLYNTKTTLSEQMISAYKKMKSQLEFIGDTM